MTRTCSAVAFVAAAALAGVGLLRGTYAAGGSDSSCYALMAEAFASGTLQPVSALAVAAPWPDAPGTFAPGGFVSSPISPSVSAPICAPGFSLLLAPAVALAGLDAVFWGTPLAGAALVWATFLAGRALGGPVAGAMAGVLVAASPPVLYQVVQPMNDVTTAALWMAVFASLLTGRWAVAGACCGLALLVRPNLLPAAAVAGAFVVLGDRASAGSWRGRIRWKAAVAFGGAALPCALAVLWLNSELYGSPLSTGYGPPRRLFGLSVLPTNAVRYTGWLVETHTAFPLLALAAPFVSGPARRRDVLLALGLVAAVVAIYFVYVPFDDWSYLRFLLPAIALLLVLASVVTVALVGRAASRLGWTADASATVAGTTLAQAAVLVVVTLALAVFFVRTAGDRHAFDLQFLEQRYRSAGTVVRERLPPAAVVLSVWDSGAVRFHGRREAVVWTALEPAWLDRSLAWLEQRGHPAYILVESWEEPGFRTRFGPHSDIGRLDWPPAYEIDRMVRIYDPHDRARYHRGDRVDTQFLWPARRRPGDR